MESPNGFCKMEIWMFPLALFFDGKYGNSYGNPGEMEMVGCFDGNSDYSIFFWWDMGTSFVTNVANAGKSSCFNGVLPSGKRLQTLWKKPPCFMGKSTIFYGHFNNSKLLVITRPGNGKSLQWMGGIFPAGHVWMFEPQMVSQTMSWIAKWKKHVLGKKKHEHVLIP